MKINKINTFNNKYMLEVDKVTDHCCCGVARCSTGCCCYPPSRAWCRRGRAPWRWWAGRCPCHCSPPVYSWLNFLFDFSSVLYFLTLSYLTQSCLTLTQPSSEIEKLLLSHYESWLNIHLEKKKEFLLKIWIFSKYLK